MTVAALVHSAAAASHHHHHYHHSAWWLLALAGLIAGLAVGLTGMGGGAIMTPMLVLLFRVDPKVAIASDLVSSLTMKPVGSGVHIRHGRIHWRLVGYLASASVPAAFLGAYTLNQFGDSSSVQSHLKTVLGWVLLAACASLVVKATILNRAKHRDDLDAGSDPDHADATPLQVRVVPTLAVGLLGGFVVGMTSVGSGSMMIVTLMLLYPKLSARSLVGTDLVQAVPLVASATLGQLLFGHVDLGLAGSLLIGSLPGVYAGSRLSARAPDGVIRPVLVAVLAASALGLLLAGHSSGLAVALALLVVVGIPLWAAIDAAVHTPAEWRSSGRRRNRWIGVLGGGAPFGIGLVTAAAYFVRVRPALRRPPTPSSAAGLGMAQPPLPSRGPSC